jgi:hypothetical protein
LGWQGLRGPPHPCLTRRFGVGPMPMKGQKQTTKLSWFHKSFWNQFLFVVNLNWNVKKVGLVEKRKKNFPMGLRYFFSSPLFKRLQSTLVSGGKVSKERIKERKKDRRQTDGQTERLAFLIKATSLMLYFEKR